MKKVFLFLTATLCGLATLAQKDVIISGGYSVSSVVCSNSSVYVTGSNEVQAGTGILGVGSSSEYVSSWTKVNFPEDASGHSEVYISQVNSGNGLHFIALDCYGQVWGWGDNGYGQTGIGSDSPAVVTAPAQVKLGSGSPLAGTAYDDGYGNLASVDVVYAGYANSFAILGDGPYKGRVVAWGGNIVNNDYTSCLGTGSDDQAFYPTFCKDLNGNYMTDAIRVFSSDHISMILKSDGTVWTCGDETYGNYLGRNANGGYFTGSGGASNAFGAVYLSENEMLTDIKEIACGAGANFALDKKGYIWSWGNDAWNGCGGTGTNGNSVPTRVLAGETYEEDNDGTYLLAKSIDAGQAIGMAVTISGRPVAWGGGGSNGGYVGDGTEMTRQKPVYIKCGIIIHSDVVLVNRGATYGFYGRSDGSMYAWGFNAHGQLGIGSTTTQLSAIKINPPTGCSFRDPVPMATITPGDMKVCASDFYGVELDCGFSVGTLAYNYKFTWYKDGQKITSASGNGTKTSYTTQNGESGIGTYKVVVEYVGDNSGCMSYEPAEAEMTISAYEQEFTLENVYFCGNEAHVKVTPLNSESTAEYTWFTDQAGTTELGKSIGDEEITIDVSSIHANSNGSKTIYVQETSMGSGLFLPEQLTNWKNGSDYCGVGTLNSMCATGFYVKEPITLTSLSFYAEASTFSDATNTTLTFTVCGAKSGSNGFMTPNTSTSYGRFVCTETITATSSNTQKYTATGSVSLTEGLYFIVPTRLECASSIQYKLCRGMSSLATTNVDNLTGNILQFQSVVQYDNTTNSSGYIFDITFTTGQKFCDIIPVTLLQDCPCNAPDDFTILNSDASYFSATHDTAIVCANNVKCSFTTSWWAVSSSTAFEYIWYKDDVVARSATIGSFSDSFLVTTAGTYKILVRDKNAPNATSCQLEKTVEVLENPIPTVSVSGGGEIYEGETLETPVTFTMTGEPRFRVYWEEQKDGGTPLIKNKRSSSYTMELQTPTDVGVYTYTVKSVNDDGSCKNENVAGTATITIKSKTNPAVNIIATEIPEIEISNEDEALPTIDLSSYYTTDTPAEITYTATSSDPSIVVPVIRGNELEFIQYGDGTVTITVTATSGETVTNQTFTITVQPKQDQPTKPCELTVEPTISNVTCFGGEDGKIEVSVSGGVEPYTYKWNTGRTSKGIYAMAAGEYSILVRDSLGCTTTNSFTIEEPAEIVVTETITNPSCGNSNGSIAISVEGGTAPYTQRWYSGNGSSMESLENLQGDVYEVVIIDKNSCKLRKTYALQESGAPTIILKNANASKCNDATGNCEIEISSESAYSVIWSDSTEVASNTIRPTLFPGTYTVTVNDENNCRSILSVTIPTETFRQPEIALVTVGEESGKNLVVWQKPETDVIDFYTVYREGDESGVYDKLGDVPFNEMSIFVDPDANIMEQSWRYKISATDVCGNESPLSKEHKTIHLQKSRGLDGEVNLIWDSYEGIAYASYLLYRQTSSRSELEMFKKVPASLNRFTDMNPPADIKGYYVAIQLLDTIDVNKPLKAESGPFALAISNIAELETDIDDAITDIAENSVVVYAKDKTIVVESVLQNNIIVFDITGQVIVQKQNVETAAIPVQNVGAYLVFVGNKAYKVVVQ